RAAGEIRRGSIQAEHARHVIAAACELDEPVPYRNELGHVTLEHLRRRRVGGALRLAFAQEPRVVRGPRFLEQRPPRLPRLGLAEAAEAKLHRLPTALQDLELSDLGDLLGGSVVRLSEWPRLVLGADGSDPRLGAIGELVILRHQPTG